MKWKAIIGLFAVVAAAGIGLVSLVFYYGFEWKDLADLSFYENLANPDVRIVRVQEGLRKEQIADLLQQKLDWTDAEKEEFINPTLAMADGTTTNLEGKYFPKTYMLHIGSDSPIIVSTVMVGAYDRETSAIKKQKTTQIINADTALKIASIIQREAAGKNDMNLISGIIWNRIFKGMKLQIDATLQYAKGNDEDGWWPPVLSQDKYIDSLYNTYKYKDLPPSPIANPGLAAITAAYNPQKTTCLFYMHDKNRKIHCSATYEGHLQNIKRYY